MDALLKGLPLFHGHGPDAGNGGSEGVELGVGHLEKLFQRPQVALRLSRIRWGGVGAERAGEGGGTEDEAEHGRIHDGGFRKGGG